MVLVFDLDDTLYEEMSYVRSGFQAVGTFMNHRWGVPEGESAKAMGIVLAREGRGRVFDMVLEEYGLRTSVNVRACVSAYRNHDPKIELWAAAKRCLGRFKTTPMYVVTDGNKIVQGRKASALAVDRYVKKVFRTHSYRTMHVKPSPYCFELIAGREGVDPSEICYVGDDPHKDFVGIKPKGFKTVRVLTGKHSETVLDSAHEAHMTVKCLDELSPILVDEI
jgi:putative hydrolase of the HAD superfamily